jgi:hypothetical protein
VFFKNFLKKEGKMRKKKAVAIGVLFAIFMFSVAVFKFKPFLAGFILFGTFITGIFNFIFGVHVSFFLILFFQYLIILFFAFYILAMAKIKTYRASVS